MNTHKRLLLLILATVLFSFNLFSQGSVEQRKALFKVAFVFKFTENIYWPLEDQMKEFVMCVMVPKEKAGYYKLLEKQKFRKRMPIRVVECNSVADITDDCHMLVVDAARGDNLWSAYAKIRGKKVMMVAENLPDYTKSMISFVEDKSGTFKYITNKTKIKESNLVVKQQLYALAIVKEGEWKSIFEKFEAIAKGNNKNLGADASDVAQFLKVYKNLEEEKKDKEDRLARMSDSLDQIALTLKANIEENEKVSKSIEEQKKKMSVLDGEIIAKEAAIKDKERTIGEKNNVISIIAALSAIGILLLIFTIRSNNQRRRANKLLSEQKSEIERQKHLVDEKQKEILDSINYAKRIQTALMANAKMMNDNLPEHFIYFKPKDIVAGDFYWAAPVQDGFVYITADSTGHGVPGAFMSLLNISKLNDAINSNVSRPDLVLNDVKEGIIKALNPEGSSEESKDGMDAILCKLDTKNMKLQFAAANNSFCIVRNKNVITCKADKMPVGKSHDDSGRFTFNEILLEKGDMIFTFTDGYGDQFGGPEGKKFKRKKLTDIFLEVAEMPINKQKEVLATRFDTWKGELEQVDDVLVIGVRV